MKKKMHAIAATIALLTITIFWVTTIASKLFGTVDQVILVKTSILWGMLLLIPAMAATGASGYSLGGKWKNPLVTRKMARMKIAAANGIILLVPSAFYLATKAQAHDFDVLFSIVQIVELIAGATNITLLALNARDGIALSRKKPKVT